MKKIIKLFMLMLFLIPLTVKADMAAPGIPTYNAYVTKVEGIPYYESKWENNKTVLNKIGTLNYNEEIEIAYEEKIGKDTYAQFRKDNKYYYVKVDDIVAKLDSYPIEEAEECGDTTDVDVYPCSKSNEYIVLSEDGIKMHSGPAHGYEVVGKTIPKGTKLKVTHFQKSTWYYTEYDGVKGWVSELDSTIGKYINKKIMTAKNVNIYDRAIGNDRKVLGTIKANTELIAEYKTDAWSHEYLIKYNGITGYIDAWETAIHEETQTFELYENSKMIDQVSYDKNENRILIDDIKKGTKIQYNYMVPKTDFVYTTINGITGWVCLGYNCEYFYNESSISSPNTSPTTTTTAATTTSTTTTSKVIIETNSKITGREIIILCVGAAIIIALTATVTVILVNKKNKKQNIEVNNNTEGLNNTENLDSETNKKE